MAALSARVIVALDVGSQREALALVELLSGACDFYKVGSELFTAEGPSVVRRLREQGKEVFLDLKLHDIPNTVRRAARSAQSLGVGLLTVHASGGRAMLAAAVEGAGDRCGVLAVTVLTSLDASTLGDAWGREVRGVPDEVLRLASLAGSAGARGIVCAGTDAAAVRARHGDALELLIPGIRFAGSDVDDQSRVVTARTAVESGASYLVVGRAVTTAPDPPEALRRIHAEVDAVGRLRGVSGG